jgi:hypothetical protein
VINSIYDSGEVYTNTTGNELYVYYSSTLDESSVPDANAFSVTYTDSNDNNGTVSVSDVKVYNTNKKATWSLVKLTLSGNLPDSYKSAYLSYNNTDKKLQDTSGNPANSFDRSITRAGTEFLDAYVSSDGTKLRLSVPVSATETYISNSNSYTATSGYTVSINGTEVSSTEKTNLEISVAKISIVLELSTGISNINTITVSPKDGNSFYNAAGEKLESLSTNTRTVDNAVVWGTPSYSKSSDGNVTITIPVKGSVNTNSISACCFLLKQGNEEFRLRGNCYVSSYNTGDYDYNIVLTNVFSEVVWDDEATSLDIKYAPTDEEAASAHNVLTYKSGQVVEAATEFTTFQK